MLSGICTVWGNGELGRGRWAKVAFVGVGVVGDGTLSSCFSTLIASGEFTGRNVEAMMYNKKIANYPQTFTQVKLETEIVLPKCR